MHHRRTGSALATVVGFAVVLVGSTPAQAVVLPHLRGVAAAVTATPSPSPTDPTTPSTASPSAPPSAPATTATPSPSAPIPVPPTTSTPAPAPAPVPSRRGPALVDPAARLAALVIRDSTVEPSTDGVAPDLGQVDEYLELTARRSEVSIRLATARSALAAADLTISNLVAQVRLASATAASAQTTVRDRQGAVEDVARELYQQGDGGLGAIATLLSPGAGGLIGRLGNIEMLTSVADAAVVDVVSAKADVALARARAVALDLSLTTARATRTTAAAGVEAARLELAGIDARLASLSLVPPQLAIGPDGCPTVDVPGTLREGAELIGSATLCRNAVAQAATPQAALAITWAFSRLGAAYACRGVGRLLPYRADCSSFTARAFHEGAGLVTSGDSWAPSTRDMVPWDGVALDPHYGFVAPTALRAGDLVLYDTCPQGGCPYKHVVMYLGSHDGGLTHWMAHTNSCGDVAKVERFWGFPTTGSHTFLVARRVLALPGETLLPAPKVAPVVAAVPTVSPAPAR
jgi:cell wall-associated NlpC family hydrolase